MATKTATKKAAKVTKRVDGEQAPAPKRGRPSQFDKVQRAAILLKQVSDPTRLQVLLMLRKGGKHVGAICEALGQSQPAVSHHLALLRHGGVVMPTRNGKQNVYALTDLGSGLVTAVATVVG